ncbi:MAG: flagellar basal-body MS-ring/collar protein FliF [Litoreibacter sp.]
MQQLLSLWENLDTRRRLIVVGTTLAVFIGVLALSRMAAEDNTSLLYSGLTPESAGEVLSSLEAQNVLYEVRGNSIFVPDADRDRLRLSLAGQGLPASGGAGYELLDSMTGFGTTSQMFDVAYLRAKEGELARTIVANPQIKAARVHIAQSIKSPFRQSSPPTASVSLQSATGAISNDAAEAIRHLVASAVAGLQPTGVSVIDAANGTVITQNTSQTPSTLANNRAEILKQNVLRLIEARTGVGRAVVEVNVDTVSEEEMIVERKVDPDSRIAISTDSQQTNRSSQNSTGSGVTVASNLPDGDAASGDGEASSQDNETREVINYEVSQTTREIRKIPGSIARISVAVLVDGANSSGENQSDTFAPRSDEELQVLTDLVKSAIGFDEARGDNVTIRTMDLTTASAPVEAGGLGWVSSAGFDVTSFIKPGITALVVLALGLFVLRPVLMSGRTPNLIDEPQLIGGTPSDIGDASDFMTDSIPTLGSPENTPTSVGLPSTDFTNASIENFDEDPVARLRNLIDERQDETVEVLRNWIESPEEVTS